MARLTYPKDPELRKAVEFADYIGWWAGMIADVGYGLLIEVDGRLYPIADLMLRSRRDGGLPDLCIIASANPTRTRLSPSSLDAEGRSSRA